MAKSLTGLSAARSHSDLFPDDDFVLNWPDRPAQHAAQEAWENAFDFDFGPPAHASANSSGLGPHNDVIYLDLTQELGFAKGGPGGGGSSGGGTGGFTANPYTSGVGTVLDSKEYNIKIQFAGTWTADLYDGFTKAADLISKYIGGDIPDVNVFSRGKTTFVDDILISAELSAIDGSGGVLGQAGPTAIRTGSFLPATATMQFDIADAKAFDAIPNGDGSSLWDIIVLHEMMHSIGFGTIWSNKGLVNSDGFFTGANADAAYGHRLIPVEQDGGSGTAGSHWDEETFGAELMTGYINNSNNYLSGFTVASLADLGYSLSPTANQYIADHLVIA